MRITPDLEILLGRAMLVHARREGHRPGLPSTGGTPPKPQVGDIFDCLRVLIDGPLTRTGLRDAVHRNERSVERTLGTMIDRGFVTAIKHTAPSHPHSKMYALTERGWEALEQGGEE